VSFILSGKEVALEDLLSGSYFGELAALDGKPRSTRVLAVEDSDIAEISGECFIRVLEKHPQVALKVMRNMASIIFTSTARIIDLSTFGANNRVHGELLPQARAVSSDDNMAILKPIPVQSDMASRASTTRETVARVLSDLTKKGIVRPKKDSLVICDVETLEEMVEDVRG
jgi:CRP/FNR family cyclic AMP-dependent transcriptional regulator